MTVTILKGDCREVLRGLPADSVHCCVTSPPYWGLRDYGVPGQIGLEDDFEAYLSDLTDVMRHVRRALRPDGTLWLNLGDCYNSIGHKKSGSGYGTTGLAGGKAQEHHPLRRENSMVGLKHKDLCGVPWRVAFALQADGWWLRQDIIWAKPNPMPESVQDRCTKAHEYLFLLSKSQRYHFDAAAISEPADYDPTKTKFPDGWDTGEGGHGAFHRNGREKGRASVVRAKETNGAARPPKSRPHTGLSEFEAENDRNYATRNKRSVWEISTAPFPGAHFATFPPLLVVPCILAGCPLNGTVLDPFAGAGTTGMVADRYGRHAILIELNPEYAAMAERRIKSDAGMFADVR